MPAEACFVAVCAVAGGFVFVAEVLEVCTGFFGVAVADASFVEASFLASANPCMERQSRPQMPTRCQRRIRFSQPMDKLQPCPAPEGAINRKPCGMPEGMPCYEPLSTPAGATRLLQRSHKNPARAAYLNGPQNGAGMPVSPE